MKLEAFLASTSPSTESTEVAAVEPAVPEAESSTSAPEPAEKPDTPADPEDTARADDDDDDDVETPEPKKQTHVPYKAYEKLRQKRRVANERIAALEAEVAKLRAPPQQQPTPKPAEPELNSEEFWNDPAEYANRIAKRADERAKQLENQFAYRLSEMQARQAHEDFDEIAAEFVQLAEKNPVYVDQLRSHPHPAEYAYQMGKSYREARAMSEMGGPDKYKEKIRAEVLAELEKEREASKAKELVETVKKLPTSLADKRSAGAVKPTEKPAYSAMTYHQIFDKKRYARGA